jgi:hypothetical protein
MSQIGVSNSEVQNATCELAWGFGHHPEMNFKKRDGGIARERGIAGHAALEIYYKGLRDGQDHDTAAHAGLAHIQSLRVKEMLADDFADPKWLEALNWLHDTLTRYFEFYEDDVNEYEFLEVEAFHAQEMEGEPDFYLPSRLDVTVYHKRGEFMGETSPFDHKFNYDFWAPYKLQLNAQFPLYILALRAARFAGKPKPVVKRVVVNQIRTRPLKNPTDTDLFRRDTKSYSGAFIRNVFDNHMKAAVKLARYKRIPWYEFVEEAHAALGSMLCQYCDFKDLCEGTFENKNLENTIAALYEKNTYGYPPLEEIRRER